MINLLEKRVYCLGNVHKVVTIKCKYDNGFKRANL